MARRRGTPAYVSKADTFTLDSPKLGLKISLAVFGFNLFGDALRDALDPKLRLQ